MYLPFLSSRYVIAPYVAFRLGHAQTKWDGALSNNYYVTPGGALIPGASASYKKDGKDSSVFGALAAGAAWSGLPLRGELEYSSLGDSSETASQYDPGSDSTGRAKQKLDAQTVFLNGYWDFKKSSPVTPYLTVGAGFARLKLKSSYDQTFHARGSFYSGHDSHSKTNFAWNLGAGVGWSFAKNLNLDVGYRYVNLGDIKGRTFAEPSATGALGITSRQKASDIHQHQLFAGLRYQF